MEGGLIFSMYEETRVPQGGLRVFLKSKTQICGRIFPIFFRSVVEPLDMLIIVQFLICYLNNLPASISNYLTKIFFHSTLLVIPFFQYSVNLLLLSVLNPSLTSLLFSNTVYKGGYRSPVNLKKESPDTSDWYHSIVMGLLFQTKIITTIRPMTSQWLHEYFRTSKKIPHTLLICVYTLLWFQTPTN